MWLGAAADVRSEQIAGWLHWRGPHQNGVSDEADLPKTWTPDGENHLWSYDLAGRGTPVIAQYPDGQRVYVWGYRGQTTDLVEVLACLDATNGKLIWEHEFSDFLSDIIYNRYSIGAPTVDPQTGNVYVMTSPGVLMGFDRDGRPLWERSMMEELGRLTFPNGRTGAPSIEGDLVIVNAITANWGREGPARNRFYAFDKQTGELVWSSTPGVGPPHLKDSSFSSSVFEWRDGMRVFYVGTGCGHIAAVNARTGRPLWRYQMAFGGINSSIVLHGDKLIAIHGKENIDDTGRGRMVALRLGTTTEPGKGGPVVLDKSFELWRNDELSMFTSSPVIVGDVVYQVTIKGDLVAVDAKTGHTLWHQKLGADQLHASPVYADGKLYVPMWHDGLYIIRPTPEGAKVLDQVKLAGLCVGSPSIWNGRIYVHTTEKLYCFGNPGAAVKAAAHPTTAPADAADGNWTHLRIKPAEVLLRPGQEQAFDVRRANAIGRVQDEASLTPTFEKFIPPTAKVKAELDAAFDEDGVLVASNTAKYSAGAFRETTGDLSGTFRGRILPSPPYAEDFESFTLKSTSKTDGRPFAFPPLPWIGARLKWEVQDVGDSKVLAKTLDRVLFQRSMVFLGHHDDADYTIAADVMTDGNRRIMSDVGLINQRYIIVLRGNGQRLEVNSNIERLAEHVPLTWLPKQWYRLKTRVDVAADGTGVVRAKVWLRKSDEPADWNIEVPVARAHKHGSPGLYGFTPMSQFRVYIDNVTVADSH